MGSLPLRVDDEKHRHGGVRYTPYIPTHTRNHTQVPNVVMHILCSVEFVFVRSHERNSLRLFVCSVMPCRAISSTTTGNTPKIMTTSFVFPSQLWDGEWLNGHAVVVGRNGEMPIEMAKDTIRHVVYWLCFFLGVVGLCILMGFIHDNTLWG